MGNLQVVDDEARYFAMVFTMAEAMSDRPSAIVLKQRALSLLAEAVVAASDARGACRDCSVEAATRVRPRW